MNAAIRVERFDLAGRLAKFERTQSGGLKIPAFISRTGVQAYCDASGNTVREYRPAAEVLAEASYRSFEGVPVTRLHPPELVTAATWREHTIGTVRDVRPDGNRVAAELVIEDALAIAEIEAGDLIEISAGYTAEVAQLSGVHEGEPYDRVQQTIRGNHVALGPEGWGRAGPSVRLRLDAAHQVIDAPARVERNDNMTTTKRMVRVDGIEYEVGTESHLQAIDRLIANKDAELVALRTKLDGELARVQREHEETKGRLDAAADSAKRLTDELEAEKKRADAASSQEEIDSRVAARVGLLDQARVLLGDGYKWAGKSDRQIMVDALKKSGVSVADDATDGWIAGRFAGAFDSAKAARKAGATDDEEREEPDEKDDRKDSHSVRVTTVDARTDGGAPKSSAEARARMMEHSRNAWRRDPAKS